LVEQAAQGRRQLIERRFCQGFFIQSRQNRLAALEQGQLQIGAQALLLAGLALAILLAQAGLDPPPAAQGPRPYLQRFADPGRVAVIAVEHVERCNLAV